jgi:tetratricopeptide (TPR) repeat protein
MKNFKSFIVFAMMISLQITTVQGQDIAFQAYELRMNGQSEAALRVLDSALQLYPDSARLWFEKGRCVDWMKADGCDKFFHLYTKMKPRIRQSSKCFRMACRLSPENARYLNWASGNMAVYALAAFYTPWEWPLVRYRMRHTVKYSKKAVLLAPENPVFRFDLVTYSRFGWIMGGNKKLCRAHLDTLEMIDPVYGVMARKEMSSKKHPYDDFAHYKALEQTNPGHAVLMSQLARKYSWKVSQDSACFDTTMTYLLKYLALEPGNPEAISQLCRFMLRVHKGDPVPYILAYLEAVKDDYGVYRAQGLRLMGQVMKQQGKEEEAKGYFEEAERLNPGGRNTWMKDMEAP